MKRQFEQRSADVEHRQHLLGSLAAATLSAILSVTFISRTAFYVNGKTYYSLFDDAMISMRYARNLADGFGLIWNPHQTPVEGYSNLLWTLWMAALHLVGLPESKISLAVMVTGAILLVANVLVVGAIARTLTRRSLPPVLVMTLTAIYYPLVYWTLRGMEVGLLTLVISAATLTALRIREHQSRRELATLACLFTAGVLTRDDATIPMLVIALWLVLVVPVNARTRTGAAALLGIAAPLVTVSLFRETYYHSLFPNTYYLKVTGVTLAARIWRGLKAFTELEIAHYFVPTALAAYGLTRRPRTDTLLLAGVVGSAVLYSIYIGGDAWEWFLYSNRYITPVTPLLLVLAVLGIDKLAQQGVGWRGAVFSTAACSLVLGLGVEPIVKAGPVALRGGLMRAPAPVLAIAALMFTLAFAFALRPFPAGRSRTVVAPVFMALWLAIAFDQKPVSHWISMNAYHVDDDAAATRTGLALKAVLDPETSIAVVTAGAIPYYSALPAFDELGKSDPVIARMASHAPFYPGHSKWSYEYTVGKLHPDLVFGPWGLTTGQLTQTRSELLTFGYTSPFDHVWVRPGAHVDTPALRRAFADIGQA